VPFIGQEAEETYVQHPPASGSSGGQCKPCRAPDASTRLFSTISCGPRNSFSLVPRCRLTAGHRYAAYHIDSSVGDVRSMAATAAAIVLGRWAGGIVGTLILPTITSVAALVRFRAWQWCRPVESVRPSLVGHSQHCSMVRMVSNAAHWTNPPVLLLAVLRHPRPTTADPPPEYGY
jgi:hypothetical protein